MAADFYSRDTFMTKYGATPSNLTRLLRSELLATMAINLSTEDTSVKLPSTPSATSSKQYISLTDTQSCDDFIESQAVHSGCDFSASKVS